MVARVSRRPALLSFQMAFQIGVVVIAAFLLALAFSPAAGATDEPAVVDTSQDRAVADGRLVYEANCVGCHRADGTGVAGVFPPLVDNVNVDDTEYVKGVVANGLMGEIEVNGDTYNGAMPAFALLDDSQIDSVVLFVQQGLGQALPEAPVAAPEAGALAGTELPGPASVAAWLGFLAFGVFGVFVMWPVVAAPAEGTPFEGPQAWLKASLIAAYFIILTVMLPSKVIESDMLSGPPSVWGDIFSTEAWDLIRSVIGSGVWLALIGFGIWGLRWVQKRGVI